MDSYEVTFRYSNGGEGKQIVQAHMPTTARKYVAGLPGVKAVTFVQRVEEKSSVNETKNSGSAGGGVLVLLAGGAMLFVASLPWSTMVAGGILGTWIAEKITGSSLQNAFDQNKNKTATFILIAALSLGGFGFVKGNEFKKEFDSPVTPSTPELNVNK